MRELAEIATIYISVAAGFATFWLSLYWGHPLAGALTKGLLAGGAFFLFGFVVRLLALLIVLMGDSGVADSIDEEGLGAFEESESGLE